MFNESVLKWRKVPDDVNTLLIRRAEHTKAVDNHAQCYRIGIMQAVTGMGFVGKSLSALISC